MLSLRTWSGSGLCHGFHRIRSCETQRHEEGLVPTNVLLADTLIVRHLHAAIGQYCAGGNGASCGSTATAAVAVAVAVAVAAATPSATARFTR